MARPCWGMIPFRQVISPRKSGTQPDKPCWPCQSGRLFGSTRQEGGRGLGQVKCQPPSFCSLRGGGTSFDEALSRLVDFPALVGVTGVSARGAGVPGTVAFSACAGVALASFGASDGGVAGFSARAEDFLALVDGGSDLGASAFFCIGAMILLGVSGFCAADTFLCRAGASTGDAVLGAMGLFLGSTGLSVSPADADVMPDSTGFVSFRPGTGGVPGLPASRMSADASDGWWLRDAGLSSCSPCPRGSAAAGEPASVFCAPVLSGVPVSPPSRRRRPPRRPRRELRFGVSLALSSWGLSLPVGVAADALVSPAFSDTCPLRARDCPLRLRPPRLRLRPLPLRFPPRPLRG